MIRPTVLAAALVLLAAPAIAEPAQDQANPPASQGQGQADTKPAATTGQTTTDPNLQVATVRLEGGYRASKVVGAAVYNGQNQQIGTVDDIILDHQNQASLIVISVGGFLGVGGKLVALPYKDVERTDSGHVLIQDGSKEALQKMPNFTYAP